MTRQHSLSVLSWIPSKFSIHEILSHCLCVLQAATLAGQPGRGIELLKLCNREGPESLSFREIERMNEWDKYQPYLLWKVCALKWWLYCTPQCMVVNFYFNVRELSNNWYAMQHTLRNIITLINTVFER